MVLLAVHTCTGYCPVTRARKLPNHCLVNKAMYGSVLSPEGTSVTHFACIIRRSRFTIDKRQFTIGSSVWPSTKWRLEIWRPKQFLSCWSWCHSWRIYFSLHRISVRKLRCRYSFRRWASLFISKPKQKARPVHILSPCFIFPEQEQPVRR